MRVIGLTGSIACGKSNVSETLAALGASVIDGDQLCRELQAPGGEALPLLRERFGDAVFEADGSLNRKALGSAVFGRPEKLTQLNAIMQPLIRQLTCRRMDEARARGDALCVLDMPLLYETGMDALCDRVWCVWLPRDLQLQRLMVRDHLSLEAANARLASQLSADEKAARAQVVIDTSGSIGYTKAMVPALYQAELSQAAQSSRG